MTKPELRLELLKLVWPMQQGRDSADPLHYIAKAERLEQWCTEGDGQPETAQMKRPGQRQKK